MSSDKQIHDELDALDEEWESRKQGLRVVHGDPSKPYIDNTIFILPLSIGFLAFFVYSGAIQFSDSIFIVSSLLCLVSAGFSLFFTMKGRTYQKEFNNYQSKRQDILDRKLYRIPQEKEAFLKFYEEKAEQYRLELDAEESKYRIPARKGYVEGLGRVGYRYPSKTVAISLALYPFTMLLLVFFAGPGSKIENYPRQDQQSLIILAIIITLIFIGWGVVEYRKTRAYEEAMKNAERRYQKKINNLNKTKIEILDKN